jgi:CHASE2 domain-containing sensor protein
MAPSSPFRGLEPFTESEEDASLFFGRDADVELIWANLLASRLTILYGPTGVGKTSVLRAGLVHRVRSAAPLGYRRQAVVVLGEWRSDPLGMLRDHMASAGEDGADELLVVLDQFEEYLAAHAEGPLDDDLAALSASRDPPVRLLLSLREDALALLDRFKGRIPGLFDNYLRLDYLDRDAALQAIERPVATFRARGADVELERGLPEEVVDELAAGDVGLVRRGALPDSTTHGRVEPAHLQLVMQRLWEADAASGSTRVRRATLARLGGAAQIVRSHLRTTIGDLSESEQRLAYRVMHLLVTPSGMKVRHTAHDLAAYVGAPEADVRQLLDALARPDRRILRDAPAPSGDAAETGYEIFHDVLAAAVLDWRTDYQARERRRLARRARRLRAALIAVSTAAVALAVYLWDPEPVRRLELATVDARFSVRGGTEPDPRLTLVAVDDRTLQRLDREGRGQLSRTDYARLLERIGAARPALIALDVAFEGPREPAADRALLRAIRAARERLVLAFLDFAVTEVDGKRTATTGLLGRPEALERSGVRTGYAGLPEDGDDRNRRADYVVATTADVEIETFAFAAADLVRRGGLAEDRDELPTAPRRAWDDQTEQTTWIDFHGPSGTVPRVTALDVLEGRAPAAALRDKMVVVGLVTTGGADAHRTPLDGGRPLPGPEVQAAALDTMLRGAPLRDPSPLVDLLAVLLMATLPAVAGLAGLRAVVVTALAALGLFLAAVQLGFGAGWVLAVVVPVGSLTVATLSVLAVPALTGVASRHRTPTAAVPPDDAEHG